MITVVMRREDLRNLPFHQIEENAEQAHSTTWKLVITNPKNTDPNPANNSLRASWFVKVIDDVTKEDAVVTDEL